MLYIFIFLILLILAMMTFLMSSFLFNNNIFISMEIPIWTSNMTNFSISLLMDWISILFMSIVMFISSMILIFSIMYIPKTEFKQFSLILICFVSSMLMLIISDNIIFILLGWDGLGLSSFILVIYYQNYSSASSGLITIFSNRLGDIAILLTISILMMKMNWNFTMNEQYPTMVSMLILIAAISKSAQFPFSSWLPAAMAAPTPISALVHSSTLVTAGVYILIRVMNFNHPLNMIILMMISSATTIYASMSANWEQDMKKIIALSTLSQIGMMMFAISIGAPNIAFFHLIIHALFKSMMFMCAGMMIHNFSYQDMRHMGIMNLTSPLLSSIMTISSMTLLGTPFMSGFFSKDSILESLINSKLLSLLSMVMLMSIGMTATYSFRMIKFSMKLNLKMKSDVMFSNSKLMEIPLILMVPYSIVLGTMMMWLIFPTQTFFMPSFMKLLIPMILIMGILLGLIMSFKTKSFVLKGQVPLSLWFMNFLSTLPTKFLTSMMIFFQKNDKLWQEIYGPQYMYYMFKSMSHSTDSLLLKPSFILTIILLSPLFMFLM